MAVFQNQNLGDAILRVAQSVTAWHQGRQRLQMQREQMDFNAQLKQEQFKLQEQNMKFREEQFQFQQQRFSEQEQRLKAQQTSLDEQREFTRGFQTNTLSTMRERQDILKEIEQASGKEAGAERGAHLAELNKRLEMNRAAEDEKIAEFEARISAKGAGGLESPSYSQQVRLFSDAEKVHYDRKLTNILSKKKLKGLASNLMQSFTMGELSRLYAEAAELRQSQTVMFGGADNPGKQRLDQLNTLFTALQADKEFQSMSMLKSIHHVPQQAIQQRYMEVMGGSDPDPQAVQAVTGEMQKQQTIAMEFNERGQQFDSAITSYREGSSTQLDAFGLEYMFPGGTLNADNVKEFGTRLMDQGFTGPKAQEYMQTLATKFGKMK